LLPSVPAIWKKVYAPQTINTWTQPDEGQGVYQVDDIVSHNGQNWISIISDNVWEPGVYGWNVYTE